MVNSRQQHKHERRRISIIRNRDRVTTSEDYNRLRLDVFFSESIRLQIGDSVIVTCIYQLQTFSNPIINTYPVSSH
jgi:hypothetical protein